jgi:hypothetical protein
MPTTEQQKHQLLTWVINASPLVPEGTAAVVMHPTTVVQLLLSRGVAKQRFGINGVVAPATMKKRMHGSSLGPHRASVYAKSKAVLLDERAGGLGAKQMVTRSCRDQLQLTCPTGHPNTRRHLHQRM